MINQQSTNTAHVQVDRPSGVLSAVADAPINILIVDDEPKNLTVLETVLDVPGYRLVRAGSADEALLALVAEDFAVLVLDIRMPGMTGFELAQLVKGRRKTAQIPIIFLTAYYSEDQHVLEGYGSGAVDYLHKPVNAPVLRSKVAVFADLHRKSREIANANRALLAEVSERRRAESELKALNDRLDCLVEERTDALRKLEAELRVADKRKDEFIATLAHELRNPLAPVRNAVQILQRQNADATGSKNLRDIIARQVQVMARLIDDLMDVSRINQGRIELQRERVDLAQVIRLAVEASQPQIQEGGHQLTLCLPQSTPVLDGDVTRLVQIFVNLLTNAAKYTDKNGRIEVSVACRDLEVDVCIKDTGIGIAQEHLQEVFGMFTQVAEATGRARGGLGIGLSLVRYLVELHGGRVVAQSEGLDRGSAFTVSLPLASPQTPAVQPATVSPIPAASQPSNALRILVVDDNRAGADTLAELLTLLEYDVRTVYDAEAALQHALAERPDVVLLDIGLPGTDGYEVCRRIREQPCGEAMTLIALTGWGDPEAKRKGQNAGFDAHLVKPVEEEELLAAISKARNVGLASAR